MATLKQANERPNSDGKGAFVFLGETLGSPKGASAAAEKSAGLLQRAVRSHR